MSFIPHMTVRELTEILKSLEPEARVEIYRARGDQDCVDCSDCVARPLLERHQPRLKDGPLVYVFRPNPGRYNIVGGDDFNRKPDVVDE